MLVTSVTSIAKYSTTSKRNLMGMFDYIYYKCPKCDHITEDQSKAADCPSLNRYFLGDIGTALAYYDEYGDSASTPAPLTIVAEASRYGLTCEDCKFKFKPVVTVSTTYVPF